MTLEHLTLASLPRAYRSAPLKVWAGHLQSDAQKAVRRVAPILPSLRGRAHLRTEAIEGWFGISDEQHCFRQNVEPWLSLTETQAMAGLKHYLEKHGKDAILAFLRAASPGDWPSTLEECTAEVEVLIPNKGSRIDMIVSGRDRATNIGVVIEAKLGSTLTNNPLRDYWKFARQRSGRNLADKRTRYLIFDIGPCRQTDRRLQQNREWSLLSWHVLLIRLEKELASSGIVDASFAAHRHNIWRRL